MSSADPFLGIFHLLMEGDFANGWPLHEQRWQAESMTAAAALRAQRNFQVPLWLGQESLAGKTIFIWPEQGHGDVLQFVRYAAAVADLGARVLLAAHTSTIKLLTQSFTHPNIEVVLDLEEHAYQFDFHCPVMSLPLACGTDSLDKIPSLTPYLFADPQAALVWRERMSAICAFNAQATSRIGLVWAGGARLAIDPERSLQLSHFESLVRLAKNGDAGRVQFFSLQIGQAAKQLEFAPDFPIIDLTADLKDWADTAAFIANLDLVITVDTAVAHLAAAMGKPTWILSRYNGCWRWLQDRGDSPWYPSVRLFRQKTKGEWDAVMDDVVQALQALQAKKHNDLGVTLFGEQRYGEAVASFSAALAFAPERVDLYVSRSAAYLQLEQHGAAIADADTALRLDPQSALALNNRGLAQFELRQLNDALASYEQALAIEPDSHSVQWNQALALLKAGNFKLGWQRYERRVQGSLYRPMQFAEHDKPRYMGLATTEGLAGKTILLWPEQGHGDVMQFCRYAPALAQLGAVVILSVYPSLLRLMELAFANTGIRVVQEGTVLIDEFDVHLPLMSLPLALSTDSLDKIPAPIPYLFADDEAARVWQDRVSIASPQGLLRVGLVWAGGYRPDDRVSHKQDKGRSLKAAHFAPLAALAKTKGARFFSLQLGEPASQVQDLPIIDLTADLKDWADTAALIANLDLVITCCTAVAHLAAAMGKPTWILLHDGACWRWLMDRDDSPWYPTVRLFRQTTRGDWDGVVAEVATALASYNG